MNVILIGFMGCGKSSIGRYMAKNGYELIDTDSYIEEQENRTINDIFATDGEPYFRQLETEVLKELINQGRDNYVIAVGGGLPVKEENRELLKQLGHVFYLQASVDTLEKRLSKDTTRPLLAGGGIREKIENLMSKRLEIYQSVADDSIVTDDRDYEEIFEEIEGYLS